MINKIAAYLQKRNRRKKFQIYTLPGKGGRRTEITVIPIGRDV